VVMGRSGLVSAGDCRRCVGSHGELTWFVPGNSPDGKPATEYAEGMQFRAAAHVPGTPESNAGFWR
jgi:hypothetical protein